MAKYITGIFYKEEGSNKIVYFNNPFTDALQAVQFTKSLVKEKEREKNLKDVHGRTFEESVPSYDLR